MKCERCGWPISIWQRDLFSGLCDKCQAIDEGMPGADPPMAVRQALAAHVVDLLNKGASPETIQSMMISNGLDQQTAATVIHGAITERERKCQKISCPVCGASMMPGKVLIRPSAAGAVVDVLSVFGGGITAMPQHLYFRKSKGGEQINIDIGGTSFYCFKCKTFTIPGRET